jgi:hypothetical protein
VFLFLFSPQLLSETLLVKRSTERDITINVHYARYYCQILIKKKIFSLDFRKNTQMQNFMIIRPVVAELFHSDGRTERQEEANSQF